MYKRYEGNSGRVRHIPELGEDGLPRPEPERSGAPPPEPRRGGMMPGTPPRLSAPPHSPELQRLLERFLPREPLETEDLLLMLILYLMYRESGDMDFLIMLGAVLLG